MTFAGIDIKDLGFVVMTVTGVLDMPSRKGDTIYDWGDGFTALVDEEDIMFNSRNIEVTAYWDNRLGQDFRESLQVLRNYETTETLTTEYGDYQCKLSNIDVLKDYKPSGKTVKITFVELNPDLTGGLPNTVGDASVRIDGHDLIDFGLLVRSVNGFNVPKLQSSKQTSYRSNYLSVFRDVPEVQINVVGIYVSKENMTENINKLNKTLANPGLRHFVHDGYGYQCYCDSGYSVEILSSNVIRISVKLKVMAYYNIDEIVQLVIDQIAIIERPQSDLMQTDSEAPDFIKGKDVWQAADSDKLDGEHKEYFATEEEMAGIRDTDFAQQLENETDF